MAKIDAVKNGQGIWIWQTRNTCNGDAGKLVDTLQQLGVDYVLFKMFDGSDFRDQDVAFVKRAKNALDRAKIKIVPWGYYYGGSARLAAEITDAVCDIVGATDVVHNAEKEMKKYGSARKAIDFCKAFDDLSQGATRLWLSSYALPESHDDFSWRGYLGDEDPGDISGGIMAQVYGTWPLEQAKKSVEQLTSKFGENVVITGRAYRGDGKDNWDDIIEEALLLKSWALEKRIGLNWWVLQEAEDNGKMLQAIKNSRQLSALPEQEEALRLLAVRRFNEIEELASRSSKEICSLQ